MTKQDSSVSFSLDSTKNFEDVSLAGAIVDVLLSLPQIIKPETFGAFAPLKHKIVAAAEIVDVLVNARGPKSGPRGGSLLLRARAALGYSVQWSKSSHPGFSGIDGWITADLIGNDPRVLQDWLGGVRRFVELLNPSYGEVRLMPPDGLPRDLTVGLPEIPAISIYGEEYIDLFGSEKIENAPFLENEKVGDCYWLVAQKRITEDVTSRIQANIRSYFGEDAFVIGDITEHKPRYVPKFDLSNSLYEGL